MSDNVPCEIDPDEFPPFHAFIATPELYYCYLQFLYQYDVEGGLFPDNLTIILDDQNRLHVPIDNDTLYVENDELKAKQGEGQPTNLVSLDGRTVIGGAGFYRTIDTSGISGGGGQPTNITSLDGRVPIGGSGYSRTIDTRALVNTDNPTNITSLDPDRTIIGGSGFARTIDTRGIVNTDTPTTLTSTDSRTKIGGSGFALTIDTTAITGGGSTYTSDDLAIDPTAETINFKTPYALTGEQVLIEDDITLNSYLTQLQTDLATMQTDIDGKVKDVQIATDTPDTVTIIPSESNKTLSFKVNVGNVPSKDLTELQVNDNVKNIVFEDASKISAFYIISFVGSAVGQLEFYDSGSISLINDGGNNLLMTNNVANPDITTAEFTWVQSTKTLTFLIDAIVNTNDLIDAGVGVYTIKQVTGVQDVTMGSADNTAKISKTQSNGVIDFDIHVIDQSKPTALSNPDPRAPVSGSDFSIIMDTSNIVDYGIFTTDVELLDTNDTFRRISITDIDATNPEMKLGIASLIYDVKGRLGIIHGWDDAEETIALVETIVPVVATDYIKTLELGDGGETVNPDTSGNAVIPYANEDNHDGIIKKESDTIAITDGKIEVEYPLPTPTLAEANDVVVVNATGTGYRLEPNSGGKNVTIESTNNTIVAGRTDTPTSIDFDLKVKPEIPTITTDIWVDSINGNDDNDGLTLATAYQTFDRAIYYVEHERMSNNLMTIHLHATIGEGQTYTFNEDRALQLHDINIVGDDPNYRSVFNCTVVFRLVNSRNVTFSTINFQQYANISWSYATIMNVLDSENIRIQHCTLSVLPSSSAMNGQDLVSFDSSTGYLWDNNYMYYNTVTNCAIFRVTGHGIPTIQAETGNSRQGLSYVCHNQYGIFAAPQPIGGDIQPTYPRNSIGAYFA